MTLLDDIEGDTLSANSAVLRRTVPGYDYRTRDTLATTDQKIRDKIDRDLGSAKQLVDDAADRLYRQDRRESVDDLDRVKAEIERLRRRVTTAPGGGGAVRDLAVDEDEALVALVEYDASLLEGVEAIVEHGQDLKSAVQKQEPINPYLDACETAITRLHSEFTKRQDQMNGLKQ